MHRCCRAAISFCCRKTDAKICCVCGDRLRSDPSREVKEPLAKQLQEVHKREFSVGQFVHANKACRKVGRVVAVHRSLSRSLSHRAGKYGHEALKYLEKLATTRLTRAPQRGLMHQQHPGRFAMLAGLGAEEHKLFFEAEHTVELAYGHNVFFDGAGPHGSNTRRALKKLDESLWDVDFAAARVPLMMRAVTVNHCALLKLRAAVSARPASTASTAVDDLSHALSEFGAFLLQIAYIADSGFVRLVSGAMDSETPSAAAQQLLRRVFVDGVTLKLSSATDSSLWGRALPCLEQLSANSSSAPTEAKAGAAAQPPVLFYFNEHAMRKREHGKTLKLLAEYDKAAHDSDLDSILEPCDTCTFDRAEGLLYNMRQQLRGWRKQRQTLRARAVFMIAAHCANGELVLSLVNRKRAVSLTRVPVYPLLEKFVSAMTPDECRDAALLLDFCAGAGTPLLMLQLHRLSVSKGIAIFAYHSDVSVPTGTAVELLLVEQAAKGTRWEDCAKALVTLPGATAQEHEAHLACFVSQLYISSAPPPWLRLGLLLWNCYYCHATSNPAIGMQICDDESDGDDREDGE